MSAPRLAIGGVDWAVLGPGDCRELLRALPDGCVDACVCDPPYEIGFMDRGWDSTGVAFDPATWAEVLRLVKPGGYLLAFGGTRTYDVIAHAIRRAGWEVRDSIHWMYGSGFPKSLNISKAVDAHFGAERPVVGPGQYAGRGRRTDNAVYGQSTPSTQEVETIAATAAAAAWTGWGTALKPAHEPIVLAQRAREGTYAENVLRYGTGGLNIDACRVGSSGGGTTCSHAPGPCLGHDNERYGQTVHAPSAKGEDPGSAGRWPPNAVFTHVPDERCGWCAKGPGDACANCNGTSFLRRGCERVGVRADTIEKNVAFSSEKQAEGWGTGKPTTTTTTTTDVYRCAPGCPVAELDRQSGASRSRIGQQRKSRNRPTFSGNWGMSTETSIEYDDAGGASRFFPCFAWGPDDLPGGEEYSNFRYVAKPSRRERDEGCEHLPEWKAHEITEREEDSAGAKHPRSGKTAGGRNFHTTVKPQTLMRWLARLVTPPGGTILDPFAGSGTTGMAALLEGFKFLGCELSEEYLPLIEGRIRAAEKRALLARASRVVGKSNGGAK